MTFAELKNILDATGYPVVYSHFVSEPPGIPFIAYVEFDSSNFHADNRTYHKVRNINIELYTDKKDIQAEETIEALLDAHDLPYQTTETYIESERLFQKVYEIGVT
jgi:NADPH-dependent ferric siderophore reductase